MVFNKGSFHFGTTLFVFNSFVHYFGSFYPMSTQAGVQPSGDYLSDLDGIRTLAVLMVVVHHWYQGSFHYIHYGGAMGVSLFFVLSGFLITNILLKYQAAFQSGESDSKWRILKTFYARRTLRIFPIYYLYIGVLVAFGVGQAREIWTWLFGYAYNFLLFLTNDWHSGYVEHLWSLAIEEQYYLVWPILLLATPSRYNGYLIFALIAVAMGTRALLYLREPASQFSKFPVCQFDGFGIGSVFSLLWQKRIKIRYSLGWFAAFWLLSFFMKWDVLHFHGKSFLGQVLPLFFLGCGFLVYEAAQGFSGWARHFFQNRLVIEIGKMSYGVYLYHLFVPDFVHKVLYSLGIGEHPSLVVWLLSAFITYGICWLSWHLIEQPINKLKSRFSYQ